MTGHVEALRIGWGIEAAATPLGDGRIHDTWRVIDSSGDAVLQRLNQHVFVRPKQLMGNVERVVAHLNTQHPGWVPDLQKTLDGEASHTVDGDVYRLWRFVAGRDGSADGSVEAAGTAFGRTQKLLATLPGPRLENTIDHFLELAHYLDEYDSEQIAPLGELRRTVDAHRTLAPELRVPTGYIHADCKLNNLLFDDHGQVVAVLDLDTVMWGHWAWDFGDLVRSAGSTDGALSPDVFAAITRGFVRGCGEARDPVALALAPAYLAFMLAVRFLTDHLRGDVYFKVANRGDNLARGALHLNLLQSVLAQQDELCRRAEAAQVNLAG